MTNWIFSLQKLISKLIFTRCTGSKNPVCRTWFFQIDFSEIQYRSTGGEALYAQSSLKDEGLKFATIQKRLGWPCPFSRFQEWKPVHFFENGHLIFPYTFSYASSFDWSCCLISDSDLLRFHKFLRARAPNFRFRLASI